MGESSFGGTSLTVWWLGPQASIAVVRDSKLIGHLKTVITHGSFKLADDSQKYHIRSQSHQVGRFPVMFSSSCLWQNHQNPIYMYYGHM